MTEIRKRLKGYQNGGFGRYIQRLLAGGIAGICLLAAQMGTPVKAEVGTKITYEGEANQFIAPSSTWVDFSMMDPGESRTQSLTLTNDSSHKQNFYISVGVPENIAAKGEGSFFYNVSVTSGGKEVLSYRIDSETPQSRQLEDVKEFATLAAGETTTVDVTLTMDGETMTNVYQGQEGILQITFDVKKVTEKQPTVPAGVTERLVSKVVKAGDFLGIGGTTALIVALLAALVAAGTVLWKRRKVFFYS